MIFFTLGTSSGPSTDEAFRAALALRAPRLGPADRLHAATCLTQGIEVIVSADAGFDGVRGLRRVDPLDAKALRRLLAAPRGSGGP
ncbi:MAG TPA: PIN domain-containing protein [Actinomycetota bacterium]